MKFNNKKVIIFDLDGTLIDSAPDLTLAINHMLNKLNHNKFSEEVIHEWVGNGAKTLVERALSGKREIDKNLDKDLASKALEIFLSFYSKNLALHTITYPNVIETLNNLKKEGYRLVIVTNKPFDFIEPILKNLKLKNLFEFYLGGDSLSKKKPDPMPLLHVCEKLNVNSQECVMIGDSKNDILAAYSANIQSIGVTYGYNYGEDIGKYNPDAIVDNFANIATLFLNLE